MAFLIEDATCSKETLKAILVDAPIFDEETWIPKTQVDDDSEVYEPGTDGDLLVSDWFAGQRGWT